MDKDELVKNLKRAINAENQKKGGRAVDAFGLAPAYRGLLSNSFVLGGKYARHA